MSIKLIVHWPHNDFLRHQDGDVLDSLINWLNERPEYFTIQPVTWVAVDPAKHITDNSNLFLQWIFSVPDMRYVTLMSLSWPQLRMIVE